LLQTQMMMTLGLAAVTISLIDDSSYTPLPFPF
jgi:hypothetical protein